MAAIAKQVEFLLIGYRHPDTDSPLAAGEVFTYLDGTTTESALWTSRDKISRASNPITLDSQGRAEVYGDNIYKFEIYEQRNDDGTIGAHIETINGIDLFAGESLTDEWWIEQDLVIEYDSGDSISVTGDVTDDFHVGRRIKASGAATGTIYGTIDSSSYGSGTNTTTVNITWDSGNLSDETLDIELALLTAVNPSLPDSSAARTSLGLADIGKTIGDLLQYEDDGFGDPVINHPNNPKVSSLPFIQLYGAYSEEIEILLKNWLQNEATTTRPKGDRTSLIDKMVNDLKNEGLWVKLDFLYLFAAHAEQNALYDIKLPSRSLPTKSGSPTFTIDAGYTGDGVGAYIDLGFSRLDLTEYSQDDAHLGVYTLLDIDESAGVMGSSDDADVDFAIYPLTSNSRGTRVNSQDTVSNADSSGKGHTVGSRSGSTVYLYGDGSLLTSASHASETMDDDNITVLHQSNNYSTNQVGVIHMGSYLTGAEIESLYFILSEYLQEIEAI